MLVNYNYLYNNKINFSLINSIPIKINITDTNIDLINNFFLHLEYPKRDIIVSYLDNGNHINLCNINSNNKLIPVIQQILSNDIYQYICCYTLIKKKSDNLNSTLILILNIYINKNYLTRIFSEIKIPKFIDILFNYNNKSQYLSITKINNLLQQINQFEKHKLNIILPNLIKTDRLIHYLNKSYIYHNNYQKKKVNYLNYNINGLVLININYKYVQFSNFLEKYSIKNDKTIIFAYKLDIYQWFYQIIKKNLKVCYIQTFRDYKKYYSTSNLNNYNIIIIAYELLLNQNYRKSNIKLHNQRFTRIIYDNITDYLNDNPNKQILSELQYFRTNFKYLLTNKLEYSNSEFSEIFNFISNYRKNLSVRQLSYFRQQISNYCFYQGTYNVKNITYQVINLPYSNLDKLIYLYHKKNIPNKLSYLYSPFISFYNYINKLYQKKDINCPICYENLENCPIIRTNCKHFFCLNCFFTIINTPQNKCALCRGEINQNFSLTGKKLTANDIISQDLKIVKLIDLINNLYIIDNKTKIIIYCRYQNIIIFLCDYFNHQGIKCFLNIMKWNNYFNYPTLLIINNLTKLNKIKTIQNIFILEKQNPYLNNRILQLKRFTNQINIIHLDNSLE